MRALAAALAWLAGAAPLAAQVNSAELLEQARQLYERLEIERALPLLRQLISPAWPFEVTREQRVEAYRYLGASLALVGKRDSAALYFRAALEWDPFTDLDPARFTPAQLGVFQEARRRTFAVGVRPVSETRVDPRTEPVRFTVVTTHRSDLRVALRRADAGAGGAGVILFAGENDGLREIRWDGLLEEGRLAPPGRYQVMVTGESRLLRRPDSARVFFDLRHEVEPLEDTLPDLGPADLLPEERSPGAARADLLRGIGIAAATLLVAGAAASGELGGADDAAQVVAGAGVAVGVLGWVTGSRQRAIPGNVSENERRRAARRAENEAIRRRNAERLAGTVLIVRPAAGTEP